MGARLRVPDVDDPDFVVDVTVGETAELRLAGSADQAATAPFRALVEGLHEELVGKGVREVVVDVVAADHICAPCFNELVTWVTKLSDMEPTSRYRIRVRSNPSIAWQKHGLHALSCFDTDVITIET